MRVIVKEKKETGISLAGFSVAFGCTGCSGSAGPGACPPPPPTREICKIGLSKMQFPAFSGPELGNREGLLRRYIKKCLRKNIHVYGFKRCATAVLSWLDCSSTAARH